MSFGRQSSGCMILHGLICYGSKQKKAGWNLSIKAAESMQITRYKKGGFYSFHKDGQMQIIYQLMISQVILLCMGTLER